MDLSIETKHKTADRVCCGICHLGEFAVRCGHTHRLAVVSLTD